MVWSNTHWKNGVIYLEHVSRSEEMWWTYHRNEFRTHWRGEINNLKSERIKDTSDNVWKTTQRRKNKILPHWFFFQNFPCFGGSISNHLRWLTKTGGWVAKLMETIEPYGMFTYVHVKHAGKHANMAFDDCKLDKIRKVKNQQLLTTGWANKDMGF